MNAKETAEWYLTAAKNKVSVKASKTLVLGVLAGLFIGFAGLASTAASATVESPSIAKLISALVFPAGLAMVVTTGAELFTGDCLLIIGVLQREIRVLQTVKTLITVYIGNFIGSVMVSLLAYFGKIFDNYKTQMAASVIKSASAKMCMGFLPMFVLGIGCNILVCIAVWMSFGASSVGGKICAVFFPIMTFVVCGFEHSVANMYYLSAGLLAKTNPDYLAAASELGIDYSNLTLSNALLYNLLPVTLGNILGGMVFVGLLYWFVYLSKH
ncbi:MAG: formate/nitrite transporter family protein [Clostridiales bacterium]|nr:formate/nitrite transporter family protein [Clostridiales bacterium]